MITTVKFAKVRPTAEIPTKRVEDASFTLFVGMISMLTLKKTI